ncbi:twin-arginine translocation signal domain-containing protein [Nocardia ninae]|uniref:Twin-arginine translocation signal domain-containing protein n=1 Tax=Nocardia ninae NBRC 108245 TaxID=1210091 RepID=A0A511MCL4_9NOCA|nr:twin-arginine translocation signal domain-containing protein [Nocardia ninae]GEM37838.1 hypothetical protein NN4_23570 [Nocardia ninae NBRC 108245]
MCAAGPFSGLNRRQFLAKAAAAGAVGASASLADPIIERAYAADPAGLGDIEHLVSLMQKSRSFDRSAPNIAKPVLPDPKPKMDAAVAQCGPNIALGTAETGIPYPVPPNSMPTQQPGTRREPSGLIRA